jgi:ubiquinone biosynthesis protein
MEKLNGIKLNDREGITNSGLDLKRVAANGARGFLYSLLKFGFFHGDLHGGNLFLLPNGDLGIIDFGIVGRLSQKSRDQLATMVYALIQEDYETLCYTYADLGSADTSIDFDSFQREVRNVLSPYLGLSVNEVNTGRVLIEATKVAVKYNIRVPGDWMLVFRALVTMEGMGHLLDPNFDMISMGESLIQDIIGIQASPGRLTQDVLRISKDLLALLEVAPRNLRWALRKFSANDYALEIKSPELQRVAVQMDRGSRRVSRSLVVAGSFIAGAMLIQSDKGEHWGDYPILGIAVLALGLFMLVKPGK